MCMVVALVLGASLFLNTALIFTFVRCRKRAEEVLQHFEGTDDAYAFNMAKNIIKHIFIF